MIEQSIYQRTVDMWGEGTQLILCMEEMAELTQALTKKMRGQNSILNIVEEIADVEIMLEQLKLIYDLREAVESEKKNKLERLVERIVEGKDKDES